MGITPKQAPPAMPPKKRATTRCVGLRAKGISTQPSCKKYLFYPTNIPSTNTLHLPRMVPLTRASSSFYQFCRPTIRRTNCQPVHPDKGLRRHYLGPVESVGLSPMDCPDRPIPENLPMASRSRPQMIQ